MTHDFNRLRTALRAIVLVWLASLSSCIWLGDAKELHPHTNKQPLDSEFTLVCWNVAKGGQVGTAALLRELADIDKRHQHDILCIQEATSAVVPRGRLGADFGRSFRWICGSPTGVATLAATSPTADPIPLLSTWKEVYVATPKCSLVTVYPLARSDGTRTALMVVNVHGLNFHFFTCALRNQMREVAEHVHRHKGPAIVCGDFNTWRGDRLRTVRKALGLKEVCFPEGRFKAPGLVKILCGDTNLPLDRVFCRGLKILASDLLDTTGSDHRALLVRFRCEHP